jgi:Na+-driven multidrug efflux pump
MLGKGEFKKYRKLSIFVPLAGAVVAALFSLTFWAGQEVVINSFSNDHEVLHSLRENWYMLIVLSAVTPFVGIFEGTHFFSIGVAPRFICCFAHYNCTKIEPKRIILF